MNFVLCDRDIIKFLGVTTTRPISCNPAKRQDNQYRYKTTNNSKKLETYESRIWASNNILFLLINVSVITSIIITEIYILLYDTT